MNTLRRIRIRFHLPVTIVAVGLYVLAITAGPAGALAPQPIDASEQGPLAFVAMTVMVVLFVFSLFYMDRIRQRHEDRQQPPRE
jgi:hypothetical protein